MERRITGLALVLAVAAAAPGLDAQSLTPAARRAPSYASVESSRAGIAVELLSSPRSLELDTAAVGSGSTRRRLSHSVIGAGAGLVVGAGVGALVGYALDRNDHTDAMFPAAFALGAVGAAAGLVVGAVAGALVR